MGKYTNNQELVLIRDMVGEDVSPDDGKEVLAKAGASVKYAGSSIFNGKIRVAFNRSDMNMTQVQRNGLREDLIWNVPENLFQPVANKSKFVRGVKLVARFDLTGVPRMTTAEVKAGQEVEMVNSRIDSDNDIEVRWRDADGTSQWGYVRWFKLTPTAVEKAPLWGKYEWGQEYNFSGKDELVVVAVRDVARSEIGFRTGDHTVSPSNKAFIVPGQVAYVDYLDLTGDFAKVRVWHFDHYYDAPDYWSIKGDAVVPLLDKVTGQPMNKGEYEGTEEIVDRKRLFLPVGFQATINAPVQIVDEDGDITEETDYRLREMDDVVILEVDTDVDAEDSASLAYKVRLSDDNSAPGIWVRIMDLYEDVDDADDDDYDYEE